MGVYQGKMKELMKWDECKGHVKKVDVDGEKIVSILKMCKAREKILLKLEIDDETASIIASDYYEVIKELLVALLLKNGLKSDNHECLISFFKENYPEYEYEVKTIHQLKDVRNRANYDGIFVKKEYVLMNKREFENIIGLLHEIVEK